MCKPTSYSKYQKRVIKFLNDFLGTETPFTYEKTQTNHMKVLIHGVTKPLFTGSTPSDSKSINNFMAEVKREVRLSKASEPKQAKPILPIALKLSNDKLIQGCIKSLRTRYEVIKSQEEALVLEEQSVEGLQNNRIQAVKHALSHAMQARKQGGYIKPKEMRELEQTVLKHLDFMLPNLAYYAELLDSKQKYKLGSATPVNDEENTVDTAIARNKPSETAARPLPAAKPALSVSVEPDMTSIAVTNNSADELMGLSVNNRISLLRGLSKAQALMLIDDINQALALNREQDIEAVVNLIQDKGLPLEAIISRLEAA